MTIYVLCGLPASGKTTLSKILSHEYNAKVYCYDEYRRTGRDLYRDVKKDLVTSNVVLDAMFIRKSWRNQLLQSIKDIECKKVLVVLHTPLDICIERNTNRGTYPSNGAIRHLSKSYEQPTLDEGWDEIIAY